MSSKLLKEQGRVDLPIDEAILQLTIRKSGAVTLHAPNVHPKDTCKLLSNLVIDVMFQYLSKDIVQEDSNNKIIEKPVSELIM